MVRRIAIAAVVVSALLVVALPGGEPTAAAQPRALRPLSDAPCVAGALEHALPLPTSLPKSQLLAFQRTLYDFLDARTYDVQLHWCRDKGVRDTGPFRNGVYYGTHPAVRIFYSPKVIAWLEGGRVGPIPDGAMIIKEQYQPPAVRYAGLSPSEVTARFAAGKDWTVMIKDSRASHDGWYWSELFAGMTFDSYEPPFDVFWGGQGLYCLRCHGAAQKELTFAALENVEGFPGTPITYDVDDSWRQTTLATSHLPTGGPPDGETVAAAAPPAETNPDFLRFFRGFRPVLDAELLRFPGENYDHVPAPPEGSYVTSDQCMGCHGGLNGPFGPTMFHVTGPPAGRVPQGVNYSPFGEWRWSPMGLGGRDPIFFAQIESEIAFLKSNPDPVAGQQAAQGLVNACFRCHGMMAKHQLEADKGPAADFDPSVYYQTDLDAPDFKYGALAREGVSCASCHRIAPDSSPLAEFLAKTNTGDMALSGPAELYGPFPDDQISPHVMKTATGIEPKQGEHLKSACVCGSCHTIVLPVADGPAGTHSIEQATFPEWLNSQYENELHPDNPLARTCQDCHMPTSYTLETKGVDIPELKDKIAIVQDQSYPESANTAPASDLKVRVRESGFRRHTFHGVNVFLLMIFRQFHDELGLRLPDYMSGSTSGLDDAIANMERLATQESARLTLSAPALSGGTLAFDVKVENLAGHRFPSGVGFRRAFLEVVVTGRRGQAPASVLWASGRTNDIGVLLDGKGRPLATEFFEEQSDADGRRTQAYQPHHRVITREDQAQIYEELVRSADGRFTTSFIRRDSILKDNRLLPKGWSREGPGPGLPREYLEATYPEGDAEHDPDFTDGTGSDVTAYRVPIPAGVDRASLKVKATLYSQAIQPSYLDARFRSADGPATRRLAYLTSRLKTAGTLIDGWKLRIASASTR